MGWFGRKRSEKKEIHSDDPVAVQEESLKKNFSKAKYGNFFRTRTFSAIDTPIERTEEWLEACYIEDFGWQINLLRKVHLSAPDENPVVSQALFNGYTGLEFFKAVEVLSEFEKSKESTGYIPVDPDEVEKLGYDYLRRFAEREKILFDIMGMPHPTISGRPISSALFDPETLSRVQSSHKESVKKARTAFAEIATQRKVIEETDRAIMHMKRIRSDAVQCMSSDAWFYALAMRNQKIGNDVGSGVEDEYLNLHESARTLLGREAPFWPSEGEESEETSINLSADLFTFLFCLAQAARIHETHVIKGRCTHGHSEYCTPEIVEEFKKRAINALQHTPLAADSEQLAYITFRNYCNDFGKGEKKSPFKKIDLLISFLEATQNHFEQKIGIGRHNGQEIALPPSHEIIARTIDVPSGPEMG